MKKEYISALSVSILLLTLGVFSCKRKEDTPDVSHIQIDIPIRRIEKELFSLGNKNEIRKYLIENMDIAEIYFNKSLYPSPDTLVNYIFQFLKHPYSDTLYNEVQIKFSTIDDLKVELIQAFKFAKYYFPNFNIPKIYTCISAFGSYGFGNDFILSDNHIIIGLDFFLGKSASFRPKMPKYILKRYEREYIVPLVIMLISSSYNAYDENDNTLLSEMIFYGKAYYFAQMLMPNTPDSLIAGYSDQEIADLELNQTSIWRHFIEKSLFYETDFLKKKRYIGERPRTYEISKKCPGRIGRWLGWKIVQFYAYHNKNVTLSALMNSKDAYRIFHESNYKPSI